MRKRSLFILAVTLAAIIIGPASGAQTFTVSGIGTPSGSLWSRPYGVNSYGQAVGQTYYGTQTTTTSTLPFVYLPAPALGFTAAGIYTLPTLGGNGGRAYSINNSGKWPAIAATALGSTMPSFGIASTERGR